MTKQQQKTGLNGITRITQTVFFSCIRDNADDKSSFWLFPVASSNNIGTIAFSKEG